MREGSLKKASLPNDYLSEEQKEQIFQMLFGPYLKEWRDIKGIVDNKDSTIAKRIGKKVTLVSFYTDVISKNHFNRIAREKNKI